MNNGNSPENIKNYTPARVPRFTVKQKVNIAMSRGRAGSNKVFKGEVVSVTDRFVVVKNQLGIKESFTYVDFKARIVACI